MKKINFADFDKKKLEITKNKLDKILSSVQIFLTEHCDRQHSGDIKFVVDMHDGIPLKLNVIFEVKREITQK